MVHEAHQGIEQLRANDTSMYLAGQPLRLLVPGWTMVFQGLTVKLYVKEPPG